jgi:hypothetical protein
VAVVEVLATVVNLTAALVVHLVVVHEVAVVQELVQHLQFKAIQDKVV